MYGAVLGDIIGSPFEFDQGDRTKEFDLFSADSGFTDDSVMTIAVGEALMDAGTDADVETIRKHVVESMQNWGHRYPYAGYGGRFYRWLKADDPQPYGSWGNGSAMRVSAAGWLYDSLERTREVARATAEVTHNHPEGIRGAEATAAVIFMARKHASKDQIRDYVIREFGYDLSETLAEMRQRHEHIESCMDSLPKALRSFLDGDSYEDVVRNAVSLGGDTDTLAAIAGAMAEAYFGLPVILTAECKARVGGDMTKVLERFDRFLGRIDDEVEPALQGNEIIEVSIENALKRNDKEGLLLVLQVILSRMSQEGGVIVPFYPTTPIVPDMDLEKAQVGDVITMKQDIRAKMDTVKDESGKLWFPVFTSKEEVEKGQTGNILITKNLEDMLRLTLASDDVVGIVINPFGTSFCVSKELAKCLLEHYEEH